MTTLTPLGENQMEVHHDLSARQLLTDADKSFAKARELLRPEMIYHSNVEAALAEATVAQAKLQKLALILRGCEMPKEG